MGYEQAQVGPLVRQLVRQYSNPRTRSQAEKALSGLLVGATNRTATQAAAQVSPPDNSTQARWGSTVAPLQASVVDLRNTVQYLRSNLGGMRQAMLSGNVTGLGLDSTQRNIRAIVLERLSETIHRLAGAAVSTQELERIRSMMQSDEASVLANPEGVIRMIDRELGRVVTEMQFRQSSFSANDRGWFQQQAQAVRGRR
jgi:hypothetical protein